MTVIANMQANVSVRGGEQLVRLGNQSWTVSNRIVRSMSSVARSLSGLEDTQRYTRAQVSALARLAEEARVAEAAVRGLASANRAFQVHGSLREAAPPRRDRRRYEDLWGRLLGQRDREEAAGYRNLGDAIRREAMAEERRRAAARRRAERLAGSGGEGGGRGRGGGVDRPSGPERWLRNTVSQFGRGLILHAAFAAVSALGRAFGELEQFIRDATERAEGFNRQVTLLSTIAKAGTAELSQLSMAYALVYGTKAREQAEAYYLILSSGIKEGVAATRTLAAANMLALTSEESLATSAKSLTTLMHAFNLESSDAVDIVNKLFQAAYLGSFNVKELTAALGSSVGTAAAAGVEFEELLAALAVGSRTMKSVQTTSTGLASAISNIISPSKKAAEEARRINVPFGALALRVYGLTGLLQKITSASKASGETLFRLFNNRTGLKAILALASNLKEVGVALDSIRDPAQRGEEAVRKMTESASFAIRQMRAETDIAKVSFGSMVIESEAYRGAMVGVGDVMNSLTLTVRDFAKAGKTGAGDARTLVRAIAAELLGVARTVVGGLDLAIRFAEGLAFAGSLALAGSRALGRSARGEAELMTEAERKSIQTILDAHQGRQNLLKNIDDLTTRLRDNVAGMSNEEADANRAKIAAQAEINAMTKEERQERERSVESQIQAAQAARETLREQIAAAEAFASKLEAMDAKQLKKKKLVGAADEIRSTIQVAQDAIQKYRSQLHAQSGLSVEDSLGSLDEWRRVAEGISQSVLTLADQQERAETRLEQASGRTRKASLSAWEKYINKLMALQKKRWKQAADMRQEEAIRLAKENSARRFDIRNKDANLQDEYARGLKGMAGGASRLPSALQLMTGGVQDTQIPSMIDKMFPPTGMEVAQRRIEKIRDQIQSIEEVASRVASTVSSELVGAIFDIAEGTRTAEEVFTSWGKGAIKWIMQVVLQETIAMGIRKALHRLFHTEEMIMQSASAAGYVATEGVKTAAAIGGAGTRIAAAAAEGTAAAGINAAVGASGWLSWWAKQGPIGLAIGIASVAGIVALIVAAGAGAFSGGEHGGSFGGGQYDAADWMGPGKASGASRGTSDYDMRPNRQYASGGYVDRDGPAYVHAGEVVIPADVVDGVASGREGRSGGDTLIANFMLPAFPSGTQALTYMRDFEGSVRRELTSTEARRPTRDLYSRKRPGSR